MADESKPEVKTDEWAIEARIEAKLRAQLRPEYEQLLTLWKEKDLDDVRKEYDKLLASGLEKIAEDWKKQQVPPTHDEIQTLLSQEYEEFTIKVDYVKGDQPTSELFTIRELPQAAEKRFGKKVKDKLLKNLSSLKAFSQASIDMPFEKRIEAAISLFDESWDALPEATQIVLNPYGTKEHVTVQWIENNISTYRQWKIVDAQIKVNRVKDFLSLLFQSGQSIQTMSEGLNFQQLLPQHR